ncbi:TonB-dependent receptor, partial [Escherichia coli]|nr:TonB-dependent receptor [Escherichia coli]
LKKQAGHGNLAIQYGVNDKGDGEAKSIEGSIGAKLPGDGSVTLAFDVWDVGRTRLSGRDNRTMYFAGDAREANYPNRNWFYGSGATKRENLLLNAESTVGGVTLYHSGSYGWRKDEG